MAALHPDLARLVDVNSANLRRAEALVADLTPAQFNWRSDPGRWSIGQNIAHLNIITGGEDEIIAQAIERAHARGLTGNGPYRYGFMSRWFVKSMELPVKRKFKAPKYFQPPPDTDPVKTLDEYRRNSARLAELIKLANGLDLVRAKTHFVKPSWVRIPLGARFALITTHDRRHLWQAEQVRAQLK